MSGQGLLRVTPMHWTVLRAAAVRDNPRGTGAISLFLRWKPHVPLTDSINAKECAIADESKTATSTIMRSFFFVPVCHEAVPLPAWKRLSTRVWESDERHSAPSRATYWGLCLCVYMRMSLFSRLFPFFSLVQVWSYSPSLIASLLVFLLFFFVFFGVMQVAVFDNNSFLMVTWLTSHSVPEIQGGTRWNAVDVNSAVLRPIITSPVFIGSAAHQVWRPDAAESRLQVRWPLLGKQKIIALPACL